MATIFDLGTYKCTFLPKTLWRVIHSQSQSSWDVATGDLVASDSDGTISDTLSLKKAIENHFNWFCPLPSCFLSVFSSEEHAYKWAKQRQNVEGDVYIHEIDTTKLPATTYIFSAESLITDLDITHPHATHEFIFLRRIPSASLKHKWSLEEMRESLEEREVQRAEREESARRYAARPFDSRYHYVPELHGWYDDDEECEERNRGDDIINFLEGHWD